MHAFGVEDECGRLGSDAIQTFERKTGIRGNFYWGVPQVRAGYRPDAELELKIEDRLHSRYELGVHKTDFLIAQRLAEVLEIPTAYFYAEDDRLAELMIIYFRATTRKKSAIWKVAKEH